MMKAYTFKEARALIGASRPSSPQDVTIFDGPGEVLERILRDFKGIPEDTRQALEEWRDMYTRHQGGIFETARYTAKDAIMETLNEIWIWTSANFYWIALFGGIGVILLYMCGHRESLKWLWTLVLAYVLICALGTVI